MNSCESPDPYEKNDKTLKKDYIPGDLESAKRLTLKVLSPYFIDHNKFDDKILFKEMAKRLTKALSEVYNL